VLRTAIFLVVRPTVSLYVVELLGMPLKKICAWHFFARTVGFITPAGSRGVQGLKCKDPESSQPEAPESQPQPQPKAWEQRQEKVHLIVIEWMKLLSDPRYIGIFTFTVSLPSWLRLWTGISSAVADEAEDDRKFHRSDHPGSLTQLPPTSSTP
jgi:hypothetical protein